LLRLNQVMKEVSYETKCLDKLHEDDSVADQDEYDLPSDFLDVKRAVLNGQELQIKTKKELDLMFNEDWTDLESGEPLYAYLDLTPTNLKIGLVPAPSSSWAGTDYLKLDYVPIPVDLSGDDDVPFNSHTLLVPYHRVLVHGVARICLMDSLTAEFAMLFTAQTNEYNKLISEMRHNFGPGKTLAGQPRMQGGRIWINQ